MNYIRKYIRVFCLSRKWIALEALLVVGALSVLLWHSFPLFLKNQSFNIPRNFPDPNFRRAVEKFMGVEEDGHFTKEELELKAGLFSCSKMGIQSLEGIRYLQSVVSIDCSGNQLIEVDLSNNPNLQVIICQENRIESIRFPANSAIIAVHAADNLLHQIDLSPLKDLIQLTCNNNRLEQLDFSQNPKLRSVVCQKNRLTEINLSQNPKLDGLWCDHNLLNKLDLSKNPLLQVLCCNNNRLETLLLHPDQNFFAFICNNNFLTTVPDIAYVEKLEGFNISNNFLSCDDWDALQCLISRAKRVQPQFIIYYSPQVGLDPFECAEIEP